MSITKKIALAMITISVMGCAYIKTDSAPRYHFSHPVLNYDKHALEARPFSIPEPLRHARGSADRTDGAEQTKVAAQTQAPSFGAPAARHPSAVSTNSARRPVRAPEMAIAPAGTGNRRLSSPPAAEANSTANTETSAEASATQETTAATTVAHDNDSDMPGPKTPNLANDSKNVEEDPADSKMGVELSVDRHELALAAERMVGVRDSFSAGTFIQHVLTVTNQPVIEAGDEDWLKVLYKHLRDTKRTYDRQNPQRGDLVFFHNTEDGNKDGRNNDWYSACGIVKAVDSNGTITLIAYTNGEVQEVVMNLGRPEVRRDETTGTNLNSYLRTKRMSDPEYTQYLSGELFAGFATLSAQ